MGNFNDMLKYLRVREKMSQAELADKLGVSKSTVGMYELGKREPDFDGQIVPAVHHPSGTGQIPAGLSVLHGNPVNFPCALHPAG